MGQFDPSKCGTPRGRDQHRHRGEVPCEPCREAWNTVSKERRRAATEAGWIRRGRRKPERPRRDGACSACGKAIKASATRPLCTRCRARSKRGIDIRPADRVAIYERDQWTCGFCLEPVDRTVKNPAPWAPTLDHIVPRSKGGSDEPGNLRLLHRYCNTVRNNSDALTLEDLAA